MKPQRQCICQETRSKNSIMKSTWSSLIVEGSKHKITRSYASKRNIFKNFFPFVVKYWGSNKKNISNSYLKVWRSVHYIYCSTRPRNAKFSISLENVKQVTWNCQNTIGQKTIDAKVITNPLPVYLHNFEASWYRSSSIAFCR